MRTNTIKTVKEYCRPKKKVISNQRVQKCSNALAPIPEKGHTTISEEVGVVVVVGGYPDDMENFSYISLNSPCQKTNTFISQMK